MECLILKSCLDHWAQSLRCISYLEASYTWNSLGVFIFLFNIIINDSEEANHEGAVNTLSRRATVRRDLDRSDEWSNRNLMKQRQRQSPALGIP